MKSISSQLADHLAEEVTTLASCWHITRRDGEEFFFTDHDADLEIDGDTYLASTGYSRTAIENDATLGVDNLDVKGFLDSETITVEDLRAGKFDYAQVRIFLVNWEDLSQGILKLRRGWLGEVLTTDTGLFNSELRGLAQTLSQNIGQVYSPECRADLGDDQCKVPIQPDIIQRSTAYALGDFVRVATDTGAQEQAQYENRIYEVTTAGSTGPVAPTFNETVDATTTETGIYAAATLTISGAAPNAGDTVTIGAKTYTWRASVSTIANEVLIGIGGSAIADSAANLVAAITGGAGSGTLYGSLTIPHTQVTASNVSGVVTVTALAGGTAGNSIVTTEVGVRTSFSSNTLLGGLAGAVFTARQAWTRHAIISFVQSRSVFGIQIDESRAVDNWFNGGVVTFENAENEGYSIEVRDSDVASKAISQLTITGQPSNGQQFTVGSKTYTMQTALTNVDGNIFIGATTSATTLNILSALTLGAGAGTRYAAATTAHPSVDFASDGGNNISLIAKTAGAAGNLIVTTENLSNSSFTGAILAGGADNVITVFLPLYYDAEIGDLIRIYPGCDKRQETCIGKFDNIINMRAEPFVPGQDAILKYPDAH